MPILGSMGAAAARAFGFGRSADAPPAGPLYSFSSFTFTNAGITGRLGPTLADCTSSYNTTTFPWLTDTNFFNVVTQGYQLWTVPDTGLYDITAVGAVGGIGPSPSGAAGRGAQMKSTFTLTKGDKLQIIVGQAGSGTGGNTCGQDGGGGGGSFVFTSGGTILLAAGGGGGGSNNTFNRDVTRRDAPDSTSGNNGSGTTGGAGGTSGNGGSVQSGSCVQGGGAGAGVFSAGATNGQSNAAATYSQGFTGGLGSFAGGFGGGGGNGVSYAGGGGGGYSGGGGGGLQECSCADMGNGGGGGSYSSTTYTYTANVGTGQGSVTIAKAITSISSFFDGAVTYLSSYMSEFRNTSFYSYNLDQDAFTISDGGGDMYDGGNATQLYNNSGTVTFNIAYNSALTTIDTDLVYKGLGYGISPDQRPLSLMAYRNNNSTPKYLGWQKTGNLGADGGGAQLNGWVHEGTTVNGFVVYAWYRLVYSAGDPSVCDFYMFIGHGNWNSSFGTFSTFAAASTDNNQNYVFTTNSLNIISIATLLSKPSGAQVTVGEMQSVVAAWTSRLKTHLNY
jgi:hypothetical protein